MAMPPPITPALRILQVEDCAEDAELTSLELREAGLQVECRRVDDEAGLRRALIEFRPHLVLSDLNLPGFSSTRALQLTREYASNARFILFSGTAQCEHAGMPGIDGWLCKNDAAALPGLIREWFDLPTDALP